MYPPISDRDGNVYVLYEEPTGSSVVYVGEALGGWSKGCPAGEEMLELHISRNPSKFNQLIKGGS